jgi:hypothetical protein
MGKEKEIHGLKITGEVQCLKIKLKPNSVKKVKTWFEELRKMEGVDEVLKKEGILVESIFLETIGQEDYLIFYVRADNLEKSNEVFNQSNHPVDVASKIFINDTWDLSNIKRFDLLYDVDRIDDLLTSNLGVNN